MVSSNPVTPEGPDAQVGKYRLLRRIAAGGMAEVYLATDDGKSLWAVKLILPHLADQPEFLGLFLDEARLASLINHPNVARVRDMGMENGRLFLAMEYARGQPLSSLLSELKAKKTALTPPQAAAILAQAAAGLNAAHDAKARDGQPADLVHRDVSPQNLLLTEDGVVKVVDFGIAKAKNKLVVTQVNTTRGKPWYMSPEQMRGEKLDRRADIFSLGAVLFELLLGSRLFDGDVDQVMYKALNEPLPDILALKPDVPVELAEAIKRACARRPDDRYETAWEMEQELMAFANAHGGAGDLGALITDNFPRMPASVEEVTGAAPANASRPPTRSNAGSRPKAAVARPASSPGSGAPTKIRRPGSGPTVGEAPPDEKTPANPDPELVTSPPDAPAPALAAGAAIGEPTAPGASLPPGKPAEATVVEDDAVKVRTEIPKRAVVDPKAAKKKQMLIIGGVVLACFVVGGGAAAYFATREKPPPAVPPPPQPTSLLGGEATPPAPKPNPFAAADDLPKAEAKPAAPTAADAKPAEIPAKDLDNLARVRVSCSGMCTVYVDGNAEGQSGDVLRIKPGKHTFSATLGDEAKPHGGHTMTLAALEVVALHFGKTDGSWLAAQGYADDARGKLARGDVQGAIRCYREALSMNGSNPVYHRDLGKALYKAGETDTARFHLETYLLISKSQPKDADEIKALIQKIRGG
ncbi:MAG: protein kinase [Deltaproteobacteria bacterium]|nr:protein kinase [Deltaproteobacteria bacterium]